MKHPFAELINLHFEEAKAGSSTVTLVTASQHLNPHQVVHGAVLFAMADTGMGSALYPTLDEGEICATIEIKINYFKPVFQGKLVCKTELLNRGKAVANLESRLYLDQVLVAQANGNYAIFRPRRAEA
ncbi:PaaI family thioesterase [Variovorax sp. PAMC26660]|uniref:PaaI family thioesterase n=1 Tax=Variovorax sp. PAMC26660 TaxID=2762322 RepID=UPI00164DF71A|nr:PaaI family thioesterase [Variovorax sp. PAMC26660]QNK67014.1 PaaI family thioesterase [Variovorax sp. PAMC26660]